MGSRSSHLASRATRLSSDARVSPGQGLRPRPPWRFLFSINPQVITDRRGARSTFEYHPAVHRRVSCPLAQGSSQWRCDSRQLGRPGGGRESKLREAAALPRSHHGRTVGPREGARLYPPRLSDTMAASSVKPGLPGALLTQDPQAAPSRSGNSYHLAGPGVQGAHEGPLMKSGDQRRLPEGARKFEGERVSQSGTARLGREQCFRQMEQQR